MSETVSPKELTLREKKEKRKTARRSARHERDGALHHVDSIYRPQVNAIQQEWKKARREVLANYDEQLAEADKALN